MRTDNIHLRETTQQNITGLEYFATADLLRLAASPSEEASLGVFLQQLRAQLVTPWPKTPVKHQLDDACGTKKTPRNTLETAEEEREGVQ